MDSGEESKEISGLEIFLTRPENAVMLDKLLGDIESVVYHKVESGVNISDKDLYELGRYLGRSQILVNYGTYIMEHAKSEDTVKQIGRKIINVINDVSKIYLQLAGDTDLNKYQNEFSDFKDDVNDLNELIFKYVYI